MFRVFQHDIAISTFLQILADSLLCFFAVLLAASTIPLLPKPNMAVTPSHVWVALGFALVMLTLYSFVGLYRRAATPVRPGAMLGRALAALLVGTSITFIGVGHLADDAYAIWLMGYALLYLLAGLVLLRGVLLVVGRATRVPRVLIVGTGMQACKVAADLASGHVARNVVGFYPDSADGALDLQGHQVFSRTLSIDHVVLQHRIDEVIVAVREQRGGCVPMDQLLACRIRGVPILDTAAFYERAHAEVPLDSLKASWLVYGSGFVQGPVRRAIKRVFDIVSSTVLLMLASPVMLITALAIKLDSPGPCIYTQERVGLGGRPFTCMKFRSMRSDAERDGVARWAAKNDSRITRVGAVIRTCSCRFTGSGDAKADP